MDKIATYIEKKAAWKVELEKLRSVVLSCNLDETIKWGAPVYMSEGKNIVGLSAFKNYVGLWFFQGGTLKDTHQVLINAQEGKTQAMRQWRFNTLDEINSDLIKKYIKEALENQRTGNIIKPKRNTKPLLMHPILKKELDKNKDFATQFESLNMSKKREYAAHISSAKREATQLARLQKIIPMVLNGVGLHDKYKNC
ncbi:MAG: DUF1801 domain-containing protein [Flavobacteriaceae bacterium]|nr:DUF1801 domain-containing protein [Flavobacteriaceae bacterium]